MIATLAGSELPPATRDALVARADGVPLYVEELTKSIVEPGAARDVDAIPATLADSLMGRLDRLSTAKEAAQRAAVLGRELGYPLLEAMAGMDEATLRQGLGRLVDAEILFARGEPPAAAYTFKHALIQETAYQSLLKRTRQQLHARVAQVYLGHSDRALAVSEEAVALAERVEHPLSLAFALFHCGAVHLQRSELDPTRERAEEVVGVAEQLGFPFWLGWGRLLRGWARVESGEREAGLAEMQQAMVELTRIASTRATCRLRRRCSKNSAELSRETPTKRIAAACRSTSSKASGHAGMMVQEPKGEP